ncbi:hypothetical protein ACFL38_03190, partial [Candidatus Omnitrophota bacterium]
RYFSNEEFIMKKLFVVLTILLVSSCWVAAEESEFQYDSKNKRDPLMPLVTKDGRLITIEAMSEVGDLRLEGIIHDVGGDSFAIINGQIMMVGDKIGAFRIFKIEQNQVIFLKDDKEIIIKLKKEG